MAEIEHLKIYEQHCITVYKIQTSLYLTLALFAYNVTWHGEAILEDFLGIVLWCSEELLEVLMSVLFMETLLVPCGDCL